MQDLNLQPKMVGREKELNKLQTFLDKAARDEGNTIFISGEAGIGKTRLVNELKQIALSKGFQVLSGNCMYESLTPFIPMMDALRSGGLESLFAEEAPRVEAVYLATNAGILIKEVVREETELNPDVFVSMFTTVTDFLNESLSKLSGEEEKGTLNSLGYQNYRILIDNYQDTNLVIIITGRENEFLLNDMRDILSKITKTFKKTLEEWGGDESKVAGIEELLRPLITSGKYDGIYYGKEDPKARRNLLFENVSMGLARSSQTSPTLLCIEDLQWIDPSSLAMMHYIARNTRSCGLFILGTYRPEDVVTEDGKEHPVVETMHLMDREDLYDEIRLKRLLEGDIEEFLSSVLKNIDFTDEFKIRIFKETEGNPLFVIHLLKYLVDENIISNQEGIWRLTKDLKDIEIPSKIYNVIKRRMNRLEKEDRKILDYASVIGDAFKSSVLTDALGTNRTHLLEQLRNLEQTYGLIHSHDEDFKFDHAKIKEVIYREIPKELRRNYHSIIANSIEDIYKEDLDTVVGDLAFHYYQCKNKKKALFYLIKAAESAKRDYSNEEAERYYSYALELEDNQKNRSEILDELGDIYTWIGDYLKGIKYYENALTLSEEKKKRAEIKVKIGICYFRMGRFDDTLEICNEALVLVKEEDCKEGALALHYIGYVYETFGELEKAIDYFQRSLDIRRKINDQKGIARSLNGIGLAHMYKGEHNKAMEYYKNALNISERTKDLEFISHHLENIAHVHIERGETDKAFEFYEKSRNFRERAGYQLGNALILRSLGYAYTLKGEFDKGLEYMENCQKIGERSGLNLMVAVNYRNLADTYLRMGDFERALEFSSRGLKLSKKIGKISVVGELYRIIGMIYREQKKWEESIENFEQSEKIFKEKKMMMRLARNHYHFGLMWKVKGDIDKAEEDLNKALAIFKKLDWKIRAEEVKVALETL